MKVKKKTDISQGSQPKSDGQEEGKGLSIEMCKNLAETKQMNEWDAKAESRLHLLSSFLSSCSCNAFPVMVTSKERLNSILQSLVSTETREDSAYIQHFHPCLLHNHITLSRNYREATEQKAEDQTVATDFDLLLLPLAIVLCTSSTTSPLRLLSRKWKVLIRSNGSTFVVAKKVECVMKGKYSWT